MTNSITADTYNMEAQVVNIPVYVYHDTILNYSLKF